MKEFSAASWGRLYCFTTPLASADADGVIYRGDEDFAVANASRLSCLLYGLNGAFNKGFLQYDFNVDFGQEVYDVLGPTVKFGMSFLSSEAFRFGDRNALQADLMQRFFYFVEFEWLDDSSQD